MRYSIIVALDSNFALTNNFIENLLLTNAIESDNELVIVSDGCSDNETIKYLKSLPDTSSLINIIYNDVKPS